MKKIPYADLHNHTTASDGDFSPESLVVKAKESGLAVLGITDHDTVNGLKPAAAAAKKFGIDLVPGVEVSLRFKRSFFTGTLHLLIYFSLDLLADKQFTTDLANLLNKGRGDDLVKARIAEINRCFGPAGETQQLKRQMSFKEICAYGTNLTRRHFALCLKEKHGIDDNRVINSIIGNHSPAYLPSGVELKTAAAFISRFPVLTVLAHPAAGSFPGKGHYKEVLPPIETVERLYPEFLAAGLNGIEVFYPGHCKEHRRLLLSWAKRDGLIVTGGSDCHDATLRPPGVEGLSKENYELFKTGLKALE